MHNSDKVLCQTGEELGARNASFLVSYRLNVRAFVNVLHNLLAQKRVSEPAVVSTRILIEEECML